MEDEVVEDARRPWLPRDMVARRAERSNQRARAEGVVADLHPVLVSGFSEALLALYGLFLAFAVWVTWCTLRMLRSDGQAETETAKPMGGVPVPQAPGETGP